MARLTYLNPTDLAEGDRDLLKRMITLHRYREVVESTEQVESEHRQMTLEQAQTLKKDAAVGDFLVDDLPPLDL